MPFSMNNLKMTDIDTPDKLFQKTGIHISMNTQDVSYMPDLKVWTCQYSGHTTPVWQVNLVRNGRHNTETGDGDGHTTTIYTLEDRDNSVCFNDVCEIPKLFDSYQDAISFVKNIPSIRMIQNHYVSSTKNDV